MLWDKNEVRKSITAINESIYPPITKRILKHIYLLTNNKDRVCFQQQRLMSSDLKLCERTIITHIKRMVEDGVLKVYERVGWHKQNNYTINFTTLATLKECSPLKRPFDKTRSVRLRKLCVGRELAKIEKMFGQQAREQAEQIFGERWREEFTTVKKDVYSQLPVIHAQIAAKSPVIDAYLYAKRHDRVPDTITMVGQEESRSETNHMIVSPTRSPLELSNSNHMIAQAVEGDRTSKPPDRVTPPDMIAHSDTIRTRTKNLEEEQVPANARTLLLSSSESENPKPTPKPNRYDFDPKRSTFKLWQEALRAKKLKEAQLREESERNPMTEERKQEILTRIARRRNGLAV